MHRFLWMVLRSLCSPRKKQKVKMQISRQTSDKRMPTHVMTSRSRSCMLSAFCGKKKKKQRQQSLKKIFSKNTASINATHATYMSHAFIHTRRQTFPSPDSCESGCVSLCVQGHCVTLCCTGVLALSISVLHLAGRAMLNIALLWWIYCSSPSRCVHTGLPS